MASGPKYLAFWSYTRFDDKNDDDWVTGLRKSLVDEVRALFGKRIEIFQDIDGIAWGERWKRKLTSSSDDAVFLIPVITPTYFESEACRQELDDFVARERAAGFDELILPLYYIEAQQLEDQFKKGSDYLAQVVAEHNYGDERDLRHRSLSSYEAKQKIKALATGLMKRLDEYALRRLSTIAMRARFTEPQDHAKAPRRALVRGTLEGISAWADVWLVVETGAVYHPQAQLARGNGAFQALVSIGRDGLDHGHEFPVHVLAVTEDVTKAFERYQKDSGKNKKWPGIPKPTASRILATARVTRDDSA